MFASTSFACMPSLKYVCAIATKLSPTLKFGTNQPTNRQIEQPQYTQGHKKEDYIQHLKDEC